MLYTTSCLKFLKGEINKIVLLVLRKHEDALLYGADVEQGLHSAS